MVIICDNYMIIKVIMIRRIIFVVIIFTRIIQ